MGIHSRKLTVSCRLYNPSDVFSKLGLGRGRTLKYKARHLLRGSNKISVKLEEVLPLRKTGLKSPENTNVVCARTNMKKMAHTIENKIQSGYGNKTKISDVTIIFLHHS